MKYENMVKLMANSNRTQFERADILIKEMSKLTIDLLDYRYTAEHYKGEGTAINDRKNQIKNSLVLVMTDIDIYMEQMGMTEEVKDKANKRLGKLVNKID